MVKRHVEGEIFTGTLKGTKSHKLVEAITNVLILETNRWVLPNVVVETEGTDIVFRPSRENPLEGLRNK